jgi:hypothetical protein
MTLGITGFCPSSGILKNIKEHNVKVQ